MRHHRDRRRLRGRGERLDGRAAPGGRRARPGRHVRARRRAAGGVEVVARRQHGARPRPHDPRRRRGPLGRRASSSRGWWRSGVPGRCRSSGSCGPSRSRRSTRPRRAPRAATTVKPVLTPGLVAGALGDILLAAARAPGSRRRSSGASSAGSSSERGVSRERLRRALAVVGRRTSRASGARCGTSSSVRAEHALRARARARARCRAREWFTGARLNYAEHALRPAEEDRSRRGDRPLADARARSS